ncbi:MAG: DUF1365 domain-containing protein [Acidobacteriota bacterium]|nr:DUF1365 domain-containing protein [Acidobacteriota bacterium]MDE3043236.1 DUF1365 domain-containing protein [Acidobacteriota bacterium]MDE3106558.1 DUF1365 domain-containing protein [Acidobacteriota bacterium]MDE3222205.1 DUF1365 domain-containing protein [Acidobacteriota bacterium]
MSALRSSIYEGTVTHHRFAPKVHRFTYRVSMFHLYLDELSSLDARFARLHVADESPVGRRGRATRRPGHFTFDRRDFLPETDGPLDQAARARYAELTGVVAPPTVSILANLRSLGWNFNPITVYFFHDEAGRVVDAMAEVTNTPWGERHCYYLGAPGSTSFDKAHHVSPFLSMEGRYQLAYREPAERFTLSMALFDLAREGTGERRLNASMSFARVALNETSLRHVARRSPDMALRVSRRIYFHAARLWLKGVPFVKHPRKHHQEEIRA